VLLNLYIKQLATEAGSATELMSTYVSDGATNSNTSAGARSATGE